MNSVADGLPPDAFTFTVRVPNGCYPSGNHTGSDGLRGGRKSAEYHALKRAVRAAAFLEMKRIGWTQPAKWYVHVQLVRLVLDRRRRDPANCGKAELDALEPSKPGDPDHNPFDPFPGLYVNDDFAKFAPFIELDEGGIDRVTISVRREYAPLHALPQERELPEQRRPNAATPTVSLVSKRRPSRINGRFNTVEIPLYDGKTIPHGFALDGTELIPLAKALKQIQRHRPVGRR